MRSFIALLLTCSFAWAQGATIDSVSPACGQAGDYVLICGSGFDDDATVTFADTAAETAELIRGLPGKIVVIVPEGLSAGTVTIDVDGATADFDILADGAPVIHHVSARKAAPGTVVYLVGDRLRDATVEFVNGADTVVDTADLDGARYISMFTVPDVAEGIYTLRVVNGSGLDSGACSPTLEVVPDGPPVVASITPADQLPGRSVRATGTNLGPLGLANVRWTDGDGNRLVTFGFSNGFDEVFTWIPFDATGGADYDVVFEFSDGEESAAVAYTVGIPPPPTINSLEYDTGPAGSTLAIRGEGFATRGGNIFIVQALGGFLGRDVSPLTVNFTQDGTDTEAEVLFVAPGFGFFDDAVIIRVPDVADGDYDVTVTVGDETSNAVTFTVATLPLTVTSLAPTTQPANQPVLPVLIEGTGFGPFDFFGDPNVEVTWDDGVNAPRQGTVLFHNDRQIWVLPPGSSPFGGGGGFPGLGPPDREDAPRLPAGEYTVRVTRDPNGDAETVDAGTYTVEE